MNSVVVSTCFPCEVLHCGGRSSFARVSSMLVANFCTSLEIVMLITLWEATMLHPKVLGSRKGFVMSTGAPYWDMGRAKV